MARYIKKSSFPIALAIILVAAVFTFKGEAQQPKAAPSAIGSATKGSAIPLKPKWSAAVAFAESDAVRDMPDLDEASSDKITEYSEGEEKNPDNVAIAAFKRAQISAYRAIHPELKYLATSDAAVRGNAPISPNAVSAPLVTFDGVTANDGVITLNGGIVAPSDENIGVGPRDVVQTTNTGFRIWDKLGNPRTGAKPIRSLFSKLGGVCADFERGDPIVQHDRLADRWVISQFNFANPNAAPFFECIAVSKTSDPTGAYYTYAFQTQVETPTTGQNFPDYPHLGTWIDGYYMTVNQFDRANSSSFNGTGVYAFDRAKMLVGDPTANYVYFNLNLASHPEGIGSVQPADIDGFQLPGAGQPCPFAYELSDEYEIPPFNVDAIRMFNFHADFAVPANSTFTERTESPVALDPYDPRMPEFETGTRAECQQPAPAANADSLNAISYHLMYRLQYRRFGANENLTSAFVVNVSGVAPTTSTTYQAAVRYVQLRTATLGGAYAKFDNATFAPDPVAANGGNDRFLPSAAIDNQGNLAVSYSISGRTANIFPSINYAGRDFNAAGFPTAGLTGEQTLFAGTGVQIGTSNRWGDYQSLQVDPVDDCTFWTTNQYYNTTNVTFNWRTRIGSFKFPTCTAPNQGTVQGTITSCETGAPISGAFIQFNNGFSTTSGADGKYTIQLASGAVQTLTAYSMTVSHPSRGCTAAGPFTVNVGQNTNTQQDVCLSGTANAVLDTTDPNAVVVSGGNGDGKLGPNECDIMNVRLTNIGCATAKNLQATLVSNTPGVTVTPPGTVSYPNVVIDGASFNSVPFKVSTDPTIQCGTASFTLNVTFDGGSNSIPFTVATACGTGPNQTASGTLESTDPATPNNGRFGRNGIVSTCSGKVCPGAAGAGNCHFDIVGPFLNSGPTPACVTITLSSTNGVNLVGASYNGAFDPANFCTNYAGDPGGSNSTVSWQETVPAGGSINVVVFEVTANGASAGAGTPYSVTLSGFTAPAPQGSGPCAVAMTTNATAAATLGESITDTATLNTGGSPTGNITFRLFGPNDATCSTTPIFTSVVGVNGDGPYTSASFTPAAIGTYRWIASYSGDANNGAATGACNDPNETSTVADAPAPTATPTATAAATATATATATPAATATATPTATPASQALNLSTRMRTDTDNNVGIGGFTITGGVAKHVLIRALGPSLTKFGFSAAEVLSDPVLEIHGPGAFGTITNDNWRDSQEAQIKADGLAPTNDLESAIDATLPPGAYTAIITGNGANPAGVCTFEVYDLDTAATSKLANLSTRAVVGTSNNVVIAGFVLGNNQGNDRIVVRGLGPSLSSFGISNTLADPTLELRDQNGVLLVANNDWQDDPAQATEITADGLAPSDDSESAIAATLPPGLYTAILAGANNGTGVGTVEVYDLGP